MGTVVLLVVIALCIGGMIVWRRRRSWQAYCTPVSPGAVPHETLVRNAFTHGNSCLAAGKFPEAIAAFQQTRALAPKHPHVAARLAEAERRQQAASAMPLVDVAV